MTNLLADRRNSPVSAVAQYVYASVGALGVLLIAERIFHTMQIPLPQGGYRIPKLASAFSQTAQLFTYFFAGLWMGVCRRPGTLAGGLIAGAATVAVRVGFVLVTHRYIPHGIFLYLGILCGILGVAVGKRLPVSQDAIAALIPAALFGAGMALVAFGLV